MMVMLMLTLDVGAWLTYSHTAGKQRSGVPAAERVPQSRSPVVLVLTSPALGLLEHHTSQKSFSQLGRDLQSLRVAQEHEALRQRALGQRASV